MARAIRSDEVVIQEEDGKFRIRRPFHGKLYLGEYLVRDQEGNLLVAAGKGISSGYFRCEVPADGYPSGVPGTTKDMVENISWAARKRTFGFILTIILFLLLFYACSQSEAWENFKNANKESCLDLCREKCASVQMVIVNYTDHDDVCECGCKVSDSPEKK